MYGFDSDYLEGAHPEILSALAQSNLIQSAGYGEDEYCREARRKISAAAGCSESAAHFVVGGTQANLCAVALFLRPWEGVISADTGHIAVHETGAIEATGHKVLPLKNAYGKISASQIDEYCALHAASPTREHTVKPGMVYISQPTEYGTLYTLDELEKISIVCKRHALKLYADGARLVYALSCPENDVKLNDLSRLCDAYTIGGTKAGLLFGEALIINEESACVNFRYLMKQRGAMLAKGRLLGVQFSALFTDGLYERIGAHAIRLAARIRTALADGGIPLYVPSPTNQLFPVFESAQLETLLKHFSLSPWEELADGRKVMRICTSWATREDETEKLIALLKKV